MAFVIGRRDGAVHRVLAYEPDQTSIVTKAEKFLTERGFEVQTFIGASLHDVVTSNAGFFEAAEANRG